MSKAEVYFDTRRFKRDAKRMERALRTLGKESRQRTVIRKSLGPATVPMNKAAKQNAPKASGALGKSIGRVTRTYPRSGSVLVVIGVRKGFSVPDETRKTGFHNPRYTAHLVEFGTAHTAPKPFLRPAFQRHSDGAQRIFAREFWKHFAKETARVRAKGGR